MKTVELFCGTKSFSKYAEKLGHETFTVDFDETLNPDLVTDLSKNIQPKELIDKLYDADIIWMSPPCQTFSMAAGNKHWTADHKPKTQNAKIALKLITQCKYLAEE